MLYVHSSVILPTLICAGCSSRRQTIFSIMSSSTSADSFDLGRAQLPPDTVAVVTGSAEGLGKAYAEGLLEKGAMGVCIADVNEPLGSETARELSDRFGKDRVIFVKCDVSSAAEVEAVFAKTKERFGAINLVVNSAGICNEIEMKLTINVNVTGVAYGTYTAIKYMSPAEGGRGGKIINISSLAGFTPFAMVPVYTATKFAILGLTRALMADPLMKKKGISFGALCPGFVATRIHSKHIVRHSAEDERLIGETTEPLAIVDISVVRDAFLQLVLDDFWCGKVMCIFTKSEGIFEATSS